jgi:predicted nucleotidyltransferase
MRANQSIKEPPRRWYRGANIPAREIRKFARDIAKRFRPDKIILFGSYAYGTPHRDSDVDLLVIMPARNTTDMAIKIRWTLMPPFPVDLIVRTPKEMNWRLAERESFVTELVSKGKTLYEKNDARMGQKGRRRLAHGSKSGAGRGT